MDIALTVIGVLIVAAMFGIAGKIMYRSDKAGMRGVLRAWGRPDGFLEDDHTDDQGD